MGGVGQPRYLNSDQEERLVEEVRSGRFRTAGEIADWVQSVWCEVQGEQHSVCLRGWDVHRRYRGVDTRRLTLKRRSPGKRGLGRSLLRAGVNPGTLIWFADEMRVGLRGMVRRVWGVLE